MALSPELFCAVDPVVVVPPVVPVSFDEDPHPIAANPITAITGQIANLIVNFSFPGSADTPRPG
jgi:hypothetical protein